MELGRPGCPVDRLPDSPRHERGAARCLLGTGANPKGFNTQNSLEIWAKFLGVTRAAGLLGVALVVSRGMPVFNAPALTALVDRWRPETHSFHLPSGEMTITLQDVAMILALPLRGHAVTGRTETPGWHAQVQQLFGIPLNIEQGQGGKKKQNGIPMMSGLELDIKWSTPHLETESELLRSVNEMGHALQAPRGGEDTENTLRNVLEKVRQRCRKLVARLGCRSVGLDDVYQPGRLPPPLPQSARSSTARHSIRIEEREGVGGSSSSRIKQGRGKGKAPAPPSDDDDDEDEEDEDYVTPDAEEIDMSQLPDAPQGTQPTQYNLRSTRAAKKREAEGGANHPGAEENFITVVGGHWLTAMPGNKVRRLSLHSSNPEHAKDAIERMNSSHVRSLTAFESLEQFQSFTFKFGILQVLDLEGCKGLTTSHLDKICKMFHLKFLSLRKAHVKKLPSDIGKLQYLETLDIRETNSKNPSGLGLWVPIAISSGNKTTRLGLRFTEAISRMIALQTLSGIGICKSSAGALADMHNLTKLKKLSIYNVKDFDSKNLSHELLSAIEYLTGCSLKSLAIDDGFTGFLNLMDSLSTPKYIHTLELSGELPRVPKWISELQNLEKLTLSLTSLSTDALFIIAQLPVLFSLAFSVSAASQDHGVMEILTKNTMNSGGKILIPSDGFHSLQLLRFSAPLLPLLSFLDGAMPKLQRLELRFRILEGAHGVENLASLQQVLLRVSQQAPETTKVQVSDIRSSVSLHPNRPTVVVDEYYG
uniref:Uncharacterized protein n=2 Tax=Oryza sativa subsp. japonica TaxID=39947 RepID=Q2R1G7_ORYSJ|nr:hypothetical protein LOC_Os11g39230 [Oryza sativa Japonica Group]